MSTVKRIRVCWFCKEYIHIYPNDAIAEFFVTGFNGKHRGHPVQTANLNEIDDSYKLVKFKYGRIV